MESILITVERPPTHVVDRLLGKTSVAAELSNEGALAEPPGTGKLPRKQRLATHIEGALFTCGMMLRCGTFMCCHTY